MDLMDKSLMGHQKRLPLELQGLQDLLHHLGTRQSVKWMHEKGIYEKQN